MGSLHDFPMRKGKAAAKRTAGFAELARLFLDCDMPVFPVNESKQPLTKRGFKDASADPQQVKRWAKKHPAANIAFPTGQSTGIVVVDLDVKNGINGIANFKKLCKELGISIPPTYTLRTPSGGKHFYFKSQHAADINSSASKLAPGVDVKAIGGYIVGEGSVIDGNRYSRISGSLDELATMPKKLRLALQSKAKKRRASSRKGTTIPAGKRNDTLFRDACALRDATRQHKATLKLIRLINEADCKPPLDDSELERIVNSAFDNDGSQDISIRCAGDVELRQLSPLWPGVLFRRKVALVAGEPGLGKSLFSCDVAARISRAKNWPGGEPPVIGPAAVIMLSGEDDAEDTVVPRLIAAGGDLSKIHIISDVVESREGELCALSIDAHMKSIHSEMLKQKAALLVIDPISAFLAERDSHRDSSVRALLNKIRQFAVEGDYAVLLISHFNKPGEKVSSAVHRVMGSLGFVAAARSVYAIVKDPGDPDKKLVLPIKNNLGPDTEGFRFQIKTDHKQKIHPRTVRLHWDKEAIDETCIDEILASTTPRAEATKAKEKKVKEWLHKAIKPGHKMLSVKFDAIAKQKGFSSQKVTEFMLDFGYEREKEPGFAAVWYVIRKGEDSYSA